jgi:hypothetical protein
VVLLLPVALALAPAATRADDYVTIRGAYYREPSTRIIQPTVEVEHDSALVDVRAHYLLDAITSASVAAGTAVDTIFTELRNEAGLALRFHLNQSEASVGYTYSAESDYWSHALAGSYTRRLWGDTARLALSLGLTLDATSSNARTPACATPPSRSCALDGTFGGLTYTQVWSPVMFTQLSVETKYLDGFQANLYRSVPNFGYENVPSTRLRNAISPLVGYYLPRTRTALRLQYRYYFDLSPDRLGQGGDPWRMQSHMLEARVYQTLTRTLEVRLSYRQYVQTRANFWCDIMNPDCFAPTGRYGPSAVYYSSDPKLGPVYTEYPEIKLMWDAEILAAVPVLRWFAAGTFEISYGRYLQNTSFQSAHLLQTGYTLPY